MALYVVNVVVENGLAIVFPAEAQLYLMQLNRMYVTEVHTPAGEERPLVERLVMEPFGQRAIVLADVLYVRVADNHLVGRSRSPALNRQGHVAYLATGKSVNADGTRRVVVA